MRSYLCADMSAVFPEPLADVRTDLREPRGALRGQNSATPTPLPPLRISSLANGEVEGGTKPAPLTSDLRYHFLAPEGIQTPEEFLQPCKGRGAEL